MIQKLRIGSLIGIHIIIFTHIYFFGDQFIGSFDFQEFFHSFVKYGIVNAGTLLVILAFAITLIFGRFFCGWTCHFGAIQEFAWWFFKKMGITPRTVNSSLVTILPLFILLNFYIAPNIIHALHSPWGGISVNIGIPEIWAFLPGFIIGTLTFVIDGFFIVYFLGRKGFCRYICPWGAFLKLPNSIAMFKVRNTGNCIQSGNCTTNCPVGIDVSYEINNYNKVTNTNCTSCMICIEGCPSSALSYKWLNPMKENFQFNHYKLNREMFRMGKIADRFKSIHARDFILLPLVLFFGFSIDGLYGMGHFLSFGIGTIAATQFVLFREKVQSSKLYYFFGTLLILIFFWHGVVKFSIWQGLEQFEKNKYPSAISHLERAVKIYPKPIGRFHMILGQIYMENGELEKARHHILKAQNINPHHETPMELLQTINALDSD